MCEAVFGTRRTVKDRGGFERSQEETRRFGRDHEDKAPHRGTGMWVGKGPGMGDPQQRGALDTMGDSQKRQLLSLNLDLGKSVTLRETVIPCRQDTRSFL